MRHNRRIGILLFVLISSSLYAQVVLTTNVTGNVTDSDVQVWVNGKWWAQLYNPVAEQNPVYTQTGQPVPVLIQNQSLDANGNFSYSFPDNNKITPAGTRWDISFCSDTSAQCSLISHVLITGSSQNITSNISAQLVAPRFPPTPLGHGYNDAEVLTPVKGTVYYNVLRKINRQYDGQLWNDVVGGGGGSNPSPPSVNDIRYAGQWQNPSGTGANGITQSMTANGMTVAEPTYAGEATYDFTNGNIIPNVVQNFHLQDTRWGRQQDYFHNWSFDSLTTGISGKIAAKQTACRWDKPYNGLYSIEGICQHSHLYDTQIGLNYGNMPIRPGPYGPLWIASTNTWLDNISHGAGIRELITGENMHPGEGDTAGIYLYNYSWGGQVDASGEGNEGIAISAVEQSTNSQIGNQGFSATCSTGCTSKSLQIKLTSPANCTFGNTIPHPNCWLGVGRPIIDLTQQGSTVLATMTGVDGSGNVTLSSSTPVTPSVAWGTLQDDIAPNSVDVTGPPFYTANSTFHINAITGTFDTTHLLCFASEVQDTTVPSTVSVAGGVATITANLYRAHQHGSTVFQGGMCGYGIEQRAMTVGANRYISFVLGSTSATTLVTTTFAANNTGVRLFLPTSTPITSISNNGTTVSVSTSGSPGHYANGRFIFAGTVNYNGSPCTGVVWTGSTSFTCTMATLVGNFSESTGTYQLANSANMTYDQVAIYPIAYPVDVQNESLSPPLMDGTVYMMPNVVPFASGDNILQLNHPALTLTGGKFNTYGDNPHASSRGIVTGIGGLTATGGYNSGVANALIQMNSLPGDANLIDNGGALEPVNGIGMTGPYYDFLATQYGPANGGNMFYVLTSTAQQANPDYSYNLFNVQNNGTFNVAYWTIKPYDSSMNLYTAGPITYNASQHIFNGGVQMSGASISTTAGLVSGKAVNYAPYSNNLNQPSYWRNGGAAAGTITCGITDDIGNPACTMVQVTGNGSNCPVGNGCGWNLQDIPVSTAGFTPLPVNTQVTIQVHMKGGVGGEQINVGTSLFTHQFTLTNQWADYCWTFTPTNTVYQYWFASLNQNPAATPQTISVSSVVVKPGTACGPLIITQANQYVNPTNVNHAGIIDANAYTLAGNAEGSANGLPGPLDTNGKIPVAQLPGTEFYATVTACTLTASTDAQCSGTVTISPSMPDTSYNVQLTANTNGDGPHAGLSAAVDGTLATGSFPYTLTCSFNCGTMSTAPTLYVHVHHN